MYLPQDAWFYSHVLLLVTVEPHRLSKQTVSSCYLPLAWEEYRLTRLDSVHVELLSREIHTGTF